jgi:H/ACA ribonucleoprotein complex subunit 4
MSKRIVYSVIDVRTSPPWEIKRTIVKKCEGSTDPKYGHEPADRPIGDHLRFGIINLDKPAGPSSHEVTAWTKKILEVKHAGHGGTLEAVSAGKIP